MFVKSQKSQARILLALATTLVSFASISTRADDYVPQPVHLTFRHADVNSADGARVLYTRLNVAAHYACGTSVYSDVLLRGQEQCVQAALAGAVKHVDSPFLSQLFAQEHGMDVALKYDINSMSRTAAN